MNERARDGRWFGVGVLLLLALGAFVATRLRVATDITHFLPEGEDHGDVHLARTLATGELSRTLVLVVDAHDTATAVLAGRAFEAALRADPVVAAGTARLAGGPPADIETAMWQTYAPHRLAFLGADEPAARARLTDAALADAVATLKRQLAQPMSTFLAKLAPGDPLLLLPGHFERLLHQQQGGLQTIDGRFVTADEHGAVLFLTTVAGASDAPAQRPLLSAIDAVFAEVAAGAGGGLSLQRSGTHVFALHAEAQIRSDIQRVSIGSAVGLVFLFLLAFASLRLLLLAMPILLTGFVCGTAACLAVFGSVHGLTLAFGAALIGVSVDYAVHFHCHRLLAPAGASPRRVLRAIWPGLLLGAGTTMLGFAALLLSSFPGLRQLALFATVGISAAVLATWPFLPALAGTRGRITPLARWLVQHLRTRLFDRPRPRRLWTVVAGAGLLAAVGLPQLRWNDSIGSLNSVPAELLAQDRAVRDRVVRFEQRRLVVALGADDESALQTNERVAAALGNSVAQGALGSFRGVADLLPSALRQQRVAGVAYDDATLWPRLEAQLEAQQFRPAAFAPFLESLRTERPPPLTFARLVTTPLAPLIEPFRVTTDEGPGYTTFLQGLDDEATVREALASIPGARLIDIEATLSSAYGAYRERLFELWLWGMVLVFALVLLRHRRLRPTWIAYAPAALAAAATMGVLALVGVEANMLSLVALLMVVSMGVDYGVFLAEHQGDRDARDATLLAVVLAAASTLLGFGLLVWSNQPPLYHIGLTSAIGVLLCALLAPTICALARPRDPS